VYNNQQQYAVCILHTAYDFMVYHLSSVAMSNPITTEMVL
jgi:hypothetical protein